MQTNELQSQIGSLQLTVEELLSILHPGVVGLIHNYHGHVASDKACKVITEAKNQISHN